MRGFFKRRPSPSLVVAIAALVVALAGSAVAGVATVSVLSKSEKKKVGKIADTRINKRAPELSVKHAATAGDASNQMWAVVSANANLVRATPGITGVERDTSSVGKYLVRTNRDLGGCYYVASLGGDQPGDGLRGDVSVNADPANSKSVYVLTSSEAPANADRAFTLLIRC